MKCYRVVRKKNLRILKNLRWPEVGTLGEKFKGKVVMEEERQVF